MSIQHLNTFCKLILLQGQSGFCTNLDIHPGVLLFKELMAKHGGKHFRPGIEDYIGFYFLTCAYKTVFYKQCCGSGMFIPDPGSQSIFPSRIQGQKLPGSRCQKSTGSRIRTATLSTSKFQIVSLFLLHLDHNYWHLF
jgi:hypothetical protein